MILAVPVGAVAPLHARLRLVKSEWGGLANLSSEICALFAVWLEFRDFDALTISVVFLRLNDVFFLLELRFVPWLKTVEVSTIVFQFYQVTNSYHFNGKLRLTKLTLNFPDFFESPERMSFETKIIS